MPRYCKQTTLERGKISRAAHCVALFIGATRYRGAGAGSSVSRSLASKLTAGRRLCSALVLGAVAISGAVQPAFATCSADQVIIETQSGQHRFDVELADTGAERAQGLMFRESMPQDAGMLFVYPKPRPVSFWMKNTLIPLDMIFTDQRGVIVSIHKNAIPYDETPLFGGDAIFSVLELNSGVSKGKNIKIGDVLLHPAYDFYISTPCGAK